MGHNTMLKLEIIPNLLEYSSRKTCHHRRLSDRLAQARTEQQARFEPWAFPSLRQPQDDNIQTQNICLIVFGIENTF